MDASLKRSVSSCLALDSHYNSMDFVSIIVGFALASDSKPSFSLVKKMV